jgi:hypothetical protein
MILVMSGGTTRDPIHGVIPDESFLANLAAFGLTAATPARRLIAQTAEAWERLIFIITSFPLFTWRRIAIELSLRAAAG